MRELNYKIASHIESVDPMDFDSLSNALAFGSVHATLINNHHTGEIIGEIADSWSQSDGNKLWTFKVREGLKFENGDNINAEAVRLSLTRVAYLQKIKNSHSGLLEDLFDLEKLDRADIKISGIEAHGNELILRFKKPNHKVLEKLAFGLYGIVHASQFNPISGKWINPNKTLSSGAYKLSSWEDNIIGLQLRDSFPRNLIHSNAFYSIIISNGSNSSTIPDVSFGTSDTPQANLTNFGGAIERNIAYVRCWSWNDPNSILFNIENRKILRSKYYEELKQLGIKPVHSFFPLALSGVKEQSLEIANAQVNWPSKKAIKLNTSKVPGKLFQAFSIAAPSLFNKIEVQNETTDYNFSKMENAIFGNPPNYITDLGASGTNINLDDPYGDIRFMFLSKEGIRLPDTDGRITEELKKPEFDINKINELIWDQAVAWPVGHFAMGLWHNDKIDFSQINLALAPTSLQWLGWTE